MPSPAATKSPTAASQVSLVENIQALRGVAVLAVLWAHLKIAMEPLNSAAALNPLVQSAFGGIGVDLFFVISGYVICLAAGKRHQRPWEFLLARVARVSPLYLVTFLPALLFLSARPLTSRSVWNGLFYLPLLDWGAYSPPPLPVGWTLGFEMWFYLVFAFLLNFWKPARVALVLPALFFVGACGMSFYHGAWYFPRFMFHPFVMEFAMGCFVFKTQEWVGPRTALILVLVGSVGLLLVARLTEDLGWHAVLLNSQIGLAWLRVLVWGLPAALIAAGLVGLERHGRYVLPRSLRWLGTISYSLYLSHWFALKFIAHAALRVNLHNAIAITLLEPVACIAFAWVCWEWIEKPLTSWAQKRAKRLAPSTSAPRSTLPLTSVQTP